MNITSFVNQINQMTIRKVCQTIISNENLKHPWSSIVSHKLNKMTHPQLYLFCQARPGLIIKAGFFIKQGDKWFCSILRHWLGQKKSFSLTLCDYFTPKDSTRSPSRMRKAFSPGKQRNWHLVPSSINSRIVFKTSVKIQQRGEDL